jgi:two-component system cell cycle sensor histidine kinase/response regulator CckA
MRVLIIDDEEMIRSLAARILQRSGIETVGAETGAQGLGAAKSDPLIAAAIVDMTLPDIDGLELIRQIRVARPALPCIVSTGQAFSEQDLPRDIDQPIFLLPKPYRSQELVDLVRRVVGARTSSPTTTI